MDGRTDGWMGGWVNEQMRVVAMDIQTFRGSTDAPLPLSTKHAALWDVGLRVRGPGRAAHGAETWHWGTDGGWGPMPMQVTVPVCCVHALHWERFQAPPQGRKGLSRTVGLADWTGGSREERRHTLDPTASRAGGLSLSLGARVVHTRRVAVPGLAAMCLPGGPPWGRLR